MFSFCYLYAFVGALDEFLRLRVYQFSDDIRASSIKFCSALGESLNALLFLQRYETALPVDDPGNVFCPPPPPNMGPAIESYF